MNGRKAILCKICAKEIKGEYVVHEKNGREEDYHPQCAKDKELQLPITIMFIGEINPPQRNHAIR